MNLKEAFQAQNKIEELFNTFTRYLEIDPNVTRVVEKHFRSKAAVEQIDETLDVTNYDIKIYDTNKVIDFLLIEKVLFTLPTQLFTPIIFTVAVPTSTLFLNSST